MGQPVQLSGWAPMSLWSITSVRRVERIPSPEFSLLEPDAARTRSARAAGNPDCVGRHFDWPVRYTNRNIDANVPELAGLIAKCVHLPAGHRQSAPDQH